MRYRARSTRWAVLILAAALAAGAAGCRGFGAASGNFERTLAVTGPVHLEVQNGSGRVQVRPGEAGQVRIRGEVRVHTWFSEDAQSRLNEILAHPPIEQKGNLIQISYEKLKLLSLSVNYTIDVPPQTELQAAVGSGNIDVRGIEGPATLTAGSGSIQAAAVAKEVQATAGSGGLTLEELGDDVRATAGSGAITINRIRGDVRALAGSGTIDIREPTARVTAKTGSGSVTVRGASADLRALTGSGSITIEGSPAANGFWELQTGSGGVELDVPPNASFRLYARAVSGRLETSVPLQIEEQSRRELRARMGEGAARVEIRTGSGGIRIR